LSCKRICIFIQIRHRGVEDVAEEREDNQKPEAVRVPFRDIISVGIAQFLMLIPVILGAVLVFFFVFLFVSRVWW
jgi:hypothetical protein